MISTGQLKAIGFFGDSGSGKTTLIERLIERFHRGGLRVAAVKHAHHGFDIDRPGKDSYRFRAAGAAQVLIASDRRWALMGEEPENLAADGALARQLTRFDRCDVVLVEGYRGQAGIPFIQVRRRLAATGEPGPQRRAADAAPVAGVIAVATNEGLPGPGREGIPLLDLDDIESVAQFIARHLKVNLC